SPALRARGPGLITQYVDHPAQSYSPSPPGILPCLPRTPHPAHARLDDSSSATPARRGTVGRMVDPKIDAVLAANQAFYDAHEQRDLAAMAAVWEHSDRTVCVHPGWPILRTWPPIEQSW